MLSLLTDHKAISSRFQYLTRFRYYLFYLQLALLLLLILIYMYLFNGSHHIGQHDMTQSY